MALQVGYVSLHCQRVILSEADQKNHQDNGLGE
jgi:hypothetical protein